MIEIVSARKIDEYYMSRALSLAQRGMGFTSPNPMVGCVLVSPSGEGPAGRVIGEGWHRRCGGDHAEVAALKDAARRGEDVRGAAAYVSLEPCCHVGRTPPCAQRLAAEGIARVVAATTDPNPKVKGGGMSVLREAGIDVTLPCLEPEARWLNRGFLRAQTLGRPWVTLKAAASLDGRMALANGESKWITGPEARAWAHLMRASHDAVMVGVGTVLRDDPELTVRHTEGRDPLRVVLDSHLRTLSDAKAVKGKGGCLILTILNEADDAKRAKINPMRGASRATQKKRLIDAGARVVELPGCDGRVDLGAALSFLAAEGVLTLMVEGGPGVQGALIKEGLADSLALFAAPKILGEGPGLGSGVYLDSVADSFKLRDVRTRRVGGDILIEGSFTCSPDL